MKIKTHLTKRLIVTAAVVLAFATVSVGTAGAANSGRMPTNASDTWMQCGYDSVDFMFPAYASTGRYSRFAWSFDGGQSFTIDSTWYYYSGANDWQYTSRGWVGAGDHAELSVSGGTTIDAWEYRYDLGRWDYLGSCVVEVNPFDGGGYRWNYG